jgi:hypothetical protein
MPSATLICGTLGPTNEELGDCLFSVKRETRSPLWSVFTSLFFEIVKMLIAFVTTAEPLKTLWNNGYELE